MSGLPWIKVPKDLLDDPQALALAHRLADPRAPLYVIAMWMHLARFYPAGSLPDSDDTVRALEAACRWQGEAGKLLAALIDVGYMTRGRARLAAARWRDLQGAHAEKLERDRARARANRARGVEIHRATVARTSREGRVGEGEGDQSEIPSSGTPGAGGPVSSPANSSRLIQVRDRLVAVYAEVRGDPYAYQGAKDTQGLKRILGYAGVTDQQIEERWRRGLLLGAKWPGCSTMATLASHWNELGAGAEAGRRAMAPVGQNWGSTPW